ncbi:thioredoxin [Pseudoduganella armeniaca]|uniref:Thioredoxin n=2 Tax=Pseudoduganella armeniaca TaxID=2072590 RepID=A0A2R4CGX4_9BURK|nr:thioredoxin [Pseudoduganella armeniaca]
MYSLALESNNRDQIAQVLQNEGWVVACLCAAWCNTCNGYRKGFDELAVRNPSFRFTWIDIEDQADVVGDLDVVNFPTLLLQKGNAVTFFGPVLPDPHVAERLIQAQAEMSAGEIAKITAVGDRAAWQEKCNLLHLLQAAVP